MTTPLFSEEEYQSAKPSDLLPFECEQCGKTFYKTKTYHKCMSSKQKNSTSYCSPQCHRKFRRNDVTLCCAECGKKFTRAKWEVDHSKSKRHFCSRSCAATYNNHHKTTGTRRSKLEAHLEEELTRLYPDLTILFNDNDVIGSELDIYFPSLRLAFEINGIYHYEPIHGQKKLDSIVINDSHKFRDCRENNVSLCIIDTSHQSRFTVESSVKYLKIICDIIDSYY